VKVLITGRDGFVGVHLDKYLKERGVEVLKGNPDVMEIQGLRLDVDAVVHLASITDNGAFLKDPLAAYGVNVTGILNTLEFCRINNARMVFLSTSGVYRPKSDAVKESDELAPHNSYAMSKLMGEQLCARYCEDFHMPVTVLRLFNPYGPGQQGRFVVSYIFECLNKNEIPALRTPNSRRDFIYIDDVCDAVFKTLGLQDAGFDIINIGSGAPVSIVEVADKIYALYERQRQKPLEVQSGAAVDDKIPFIYADVGKAGERLSWKPETPLEKGLEKTLRHLNRQR